MLSLPINFFLLSDEAGNGIGKAPYSKGLLQGDMLLQYKNGDEWVRAEFTAGKFSEAPTAYSVGGMLWYSEIDS